MARIAIIDDDDGLRRAVAAFLEVAGREVVCYASGEEFLRARPFSDISAAVLDVRLQGMNGIEVLKTLLPLDFPVIMMSAEGDVAAAVEAIKLGAADFVEKPFTPESLEALLERVVSCAPQTMPGGALSADAGPACACFERLTPREREVAMALNEGLSNKEVARKLGCSPRTVEVHRARVFSKLGVSNVAGLVRAVSGTAH